MIPVIFTQKVRFVLTLTLTTTPTPTHVTLETPLTRRSVTVLCPNQLFFQLVPDLSLRFLHGAHFLHLD